MAVRRATIKDRANRFQSSPFRTTMEKTLPAQVLESCMTTTEELPARKVELCLLEYGVALSEVETLGDWRRRALLSRLDASRLITCGVSPGVVDALNGCRRHALLVQLDLSCAQKVR